MEPKTQHTEDRCHIVTTKQKDDDIDIVILDHVEGFVYFPLSQLDKQSDKFQRFINQKKDEILAGQFETTLVDMNDEDPCC
ncbi:hypothetical protein DES38_105144 [Streptohalobacillus salinus]|uniref:Uncharacterized protein n=1 Tax=Streptohalobacillus salinus TaxID=621096 RepID=A0A2V3WAU1_9BACI|nr:hypothetical protein [Streptohalobacillus salinus]PXW91523.1 hypothetical protein DES38_105144 [Streptohalobacillus salinus]